MPASMRSAWAHMLATHLIFELQLLCEHGDGVDHHKRRPLHPRARRPRDGTDWRAPSTLAIIGVKPMADDAFGGVHEE